ncbi:MAG: hypothetical protein ABEI31_06085 [Halodesulfurarchaeum sp.]
MTGFSSGPGDSRVVLATFVAFLVFGTVVFGFTASAHVALLQGDSVTASVTGASVNPNGTVDLVVTVRNPTIREITISNADLEATIGKATVAREVPGAPSTVTIPAGETRTMTVRMAVRDEWLTGHDVETLRRAIDDNRLHIGGYLSARLVEHQFDIGVVGRV